MKKVEESADVWVNMRDIKDTYLYTKDNYIFMYAKLGKVNIDNLKDSEKQQKADLLARNFKSNKKDFDVLSIPQTIDLEPHIEELNRLYNNEVNPKKRYILSELMKQDKDIMVKGNCYEHQQYFIIYEEISGNIDKMIMNLKQRMYDFKKIFLKLNITFDIMKKSEIVSLCNSFNNGEYALMFKYDTSHENLPFSII